MTDLKDLVTVLNTFVQKIQEAPATTSLDPKSKVNNLLQTQSLTFEYFDENHEILMNTASD